MKVDALEVALHCSRDRFDSRMRSNACDALGVLGGAAARDRLAQVLDEGAEADPKVRESAARALGRIAATDAVARRRLRDVARDDDVAEARRAALRALATFPEEMAVLIVTLREDHDPRLRLEALELLADCLEKNDPKALGAVMEACDSEFERVREQARRVFRAWLSARGQEPMALHVLDTDKPSYLRWSRISRDEGVTVRVVGSFRDRFRLAGVAFRDGGRWLRDASGPLLWLPGILATVAIALLLWWGLPWLVSATLTEDDSIWWLSFSLAVGALATLALTRRFRPASTAADRPVGALREVLKASVLGWACGLLAVLLLTIWQQAEPADTPQALIAVVLGVILASLSIALIRACSAIAAQVVRRPISLQVFCTAVGALLTLAVLSAGLYGLRHWHEMGAAKDYLSILMLFVPVGAAIGASAARVDTLVPDHLRARRWAARGLILLMMASPGTLLVCLAVWGAGVEGVPSVLKVAGEDAAQHIVPRGSDIDLEVDEAQAVSIETDAGLSLSITRQSESEPTTIVDQNVVEIVLPRGRHTLKIGDPSDSSNAISMDEFAERLSRLPVAGLAHISGQGDASTPGHVSLTLRPNTRRVTADERQEAAKLEDALRRASGKTSRESDEPSNYAVLLKELANIPFAAGSLLFRAAAEERYASAPEGEWQLIYGWTDGSRKTADVANEYLGFVGGRPNAEMFRMIEAYNKIYGRSFGDPVVSLLGSVLQHDPDTLPSDLGTLVETAMKRRVQTIAERYFIFVGENESGDVAPGTLLRGVSDKGTRKCVEAVFGAVRQPERRAYRIAVSDLADVAHLTPPERQAAVNALIGLSATEWPLIREQPGTVPVTEENCPGGDSEAVISDVGQWIKDHSVDLAGPEPAIFRDYFIVAEPYSDQQSLGLGTIVQGSTWDTDGRPWFQIVYGWSSEEAPYISASNLTYLGASFHDDWIALAEEMHALGRDSSSIASLMDRRAQILGQEAEANVDGLAPQP